MITCAVTEDTYLSRLTILRAGNGFLPRESLFQRIRGMDTWFPCKFPGAIVVVVL